MNKPKPSILISTVGTSLFWPNLESLKSRLNDGLAEDRRDLAEAYDRGDWRGVAAELRHLDAQERTCGAEINSIASMIEKGFVAPDCGLFFLHSDTTDGRNLAAVLTAYYRRAHTPVEAVSVAGLQDKDPRRFRTVGLRSLARELCRVVRQRSAESCAINATGGYKAQIAIAVLLGQAIGVPVYYKHERFSEIVAFPPMPVAMDVDLWMNMSGMLFALENSGDLVPTKDFAEDWDEKYENLVERELIDGVEYLALSATGQIFHETFRERFRRLGKDLLPPPVPAEEKRPPRVEKAGWPGEHPEVERFLQRVVDQVPQVVTCSTRYYNPDLPTRTSFRLGRDGIEGIYSPGGYCVKFRVESSAKEDRERQKAVVAALNEWLANEK